MIPRLTLRDCLLGKGDGENEAEVEDEHGNAERNGDPPAGTGQSLNFLMHRWTCEVRERVNASTAIGVMMQPNCNRRPIAFRFDAVHNRVSLQAGREPVATVQTGV